MIKKTAAFIIAVIIFSPVRAWPQWTTEGDMSGLTCILCLGAPLIPIIYPIIKIREYISDSKTSSVMINCVEASFQTNTIKPDYWQTAGIENGHLAENVTVPLLGTQVRIIEGHVSFHENGKLASCTIEPAVLPVGRNKTVQVSGGVGFYENGNLSSAALDPGKINLFKLQGIDRAVEETVSFYKTGAISWCRLKNDETFKVADYMVNIPAGAALMFSESGILTGIDMHLHDDTILLKFRGRMTPLRNVKLYENGAIKECSFTSSVVDIKNGRYNLKIKWWAEFYKNGNILHCPLAEPQTFIINGNSVSFYNSLDFYSNGNIESGYIQWDKKQYYKHRGRNIEIRGNVSFYPNGALKDY